jgi:hypothetical protein
MDITNTTEKRLEIAFELFSEGKPIIYNDIILRKNQKSLIIDTYSNYIDITKISPEMAKAGIDNSKIIFAELIKNYSAFHKLTKDLNIEYNYCCDDYGKAGILMAKEADGKFIWVADTPKI